MGPAVKECSKSIGRRLADSRFATRYFRGKGVDIGGAPDPLALYQEFFPLMTGIRTWDLADGDAQYMEGIADETFDFVFSSHCLEHLVDPETGLKTWMRVLKPGGFLICSVPDEDLYEQGQFPSTFNKDHKHTFTIGKGSSWSNRSINLLELLARLGPAASVEKLELLDATYRYDLPRFDQTLTPVAECGIEFVIRKRATDEIKAGGRVKSTKQPAKDLRLHFNQYRDDQQTLRRSNTDAPPFSNDKDL